MNGMHNAGLTFARWLSRQASRFRVNLKGTTAIEFSLVALPFFAIVAAIFEVGLCDFETEMLASAVDKAARAMLTGNLQTANPTTAQQFATSYICPSLPATMKCANLIIDVRPTTTFAAGDTSNDFYKSTSNEFCPGQPGQIMVLRVAYPMAAILPVNLFNPSAGVVSDVPGLNGRYHILMASALFEEETYAGTYTPPAGC